MTKNTENYPTIPAIRRRIAECAEALKALTVEQDLCGEAEEYGQADRIDIEIEALKAEIVTLRKQLHDLSGI